MKTCSKCNIIKGFEEFSKRRLSKDGYMPSCKSCISKYKKEYQQKNKDKLAAKKRKYYIENKDSINNKNREYEENNKEKMQEYRKKYRLEHSEKLREFNKNYYINNKKTINERNKEYRDSNSDKIEEQRKKYRATDAAKLIIRANSLKRRSAGTLTVKEIDRIIKYSKGLCYWCGDIYGDKYHLDHYTPVAKGGATNIDNMVVSCAKCNQSKGAKSPYVFANSIGKLL